MFFDGDIVAGNKNGQLTSWEVNGNITKNTKISHEFETYWKKNNVIKQLISNPKYHYFIAGTESECYTFLGKGLNCTGGGPISLKVYFLKISAILALSAI